VQSAKKDLKLSGFNLPFNFEAEQSVLGAIILDSNILNVIVDILPNEKYFYVTNHKAIYASILEMYTLGQNIDFITMLEKLKFDSILNDSDGKTYLLELSQIVPSISNAPNYARIVKEKYETRTLIEAARQIMTDATQETSGPELLLDSAEQKIFEIRNSKSIKGLQKISDVIIEEFDRLDALNSPDNDLYKPILTGFLDLDNTIVGLNRSDLILLAARPGMGKTSLALNIVRNVATKFKKKVVFFSLEMTKEQLVSRFLCSDAQIRGEKLRSGKLSETEWIRLIETGEVLSKTEIYLDDTPNVTVPEMKAKLRRLQDVDLVIVDYLQLMSSVSKIDNRVQEISEITRNLKIMAKEINVPVVTLSQLSRASEQRADHRPILSDLRDSGSIEQDADIVMFIYRKSYYKDNADNEEQNQNISECIVAKNRHGETRSVELYWQGEYMRFTDLEHSRRF
jgi:replicative DNA helicase